MERVLLKSQPVPFGINPSWSSGLCTLFIHEAVDDLVEGAVPPTQTTDCAPSETASLANCVALRERS